MQRSFIQPSSSIRSSQIQGVEGGGSILREAPLLQSPPVLPFTPITQGNLPLSHQPFFPPQISTPQLSNSPNYPSQTPPLLTSPPISFPSQHTFHAPPLIPTPNISSTLGYEFVLVFHRLHESGYVPKPKFDFSIFSGEDIKGWIYRIEQMLDYYYIAAEQRVRVAAMHVVGSLLQ